MWLDLTHNKIIAETLTERFTASVEEKLLPLVRDTLGDVDGIQMYEDHIADGNLKEGIFYYPLTVVRGGAAELLWIKWSTLPKKSFASDSPFSYIGEEPLEFSLAADLPEGVADSVSGRGIYFEGGTVKILIHTVSDDPLFLAGKYSQSFVDEMARQLTAEMSRILGVRGLSDSTVELQLVFAPGTYMEHTSESVTYRRLLLTADGCRPRDFWVRWTRLDGALSYRVSDHVTKEQIVFELGEDVPQKIREKEYRFLCGSNPNKYQSAMGKKTVTEWREVIKRAISRGELEKVVIDFTDDGRAKDDFDERLAEALGASPAPAESPAVPEEDDPVAAMAREVLRRSEERAQGEVAEPLSLIPSEDESAENVPNENQTEQTEEAPIEELPTAEQADETPTEEPTPVEQTEEPSEEIIIAEDPEIEVAIEYTPAEEPEAVMPADDNPAEEPEAVISTDDTIAEDTTTAEEPVATEENKPDLPVAEAIPVAESRETPAPEKKVSYHIENSEDVAADTAPAAPTETDAEREARLRREIEAEVRREMLEEARIRAEREAERLRIESEALRAENERLAEAARLAEEERAAEAERARVEEARLRAELEAQKRQELRERDRLTEAARLAVEEQRRIEAERAREAELEAAREAERLAREEAERIEAERRAEAERIRRDMEARRAAETAPVATAPAESSNKNISRHARIMFRSTVDLNVITRIKELTEEVLTLNHKQHVKIRMKAYPIDATTIALDVTIPESEGELLISIIKAIGNGRIGVTKITLE